ncbi:hypothetical protein PSC71_13120 [Devosia sp. J2-20]|uniref:hypothetical protein n=1 Tax=Devosia sp. J2-20 TaxID=3026161 RepID=UPI00249C6CC7|nr:hypothetical protein [Devosia sp. J2-20]WDQ98169.1 hypothetical protein PSC71_13120 [Devosia sp. J2-20]
MSPAERLAMADAIRDMRKAGIRPRDIIASGGSPLRTNKLPRSVLLARFGGKVVPS